MRTTLPASWAPEALKARYEVVTKGTCVGAQRSAAVAPQESQLLKKHVSSRVAERWGQANRNALEKDVDNRRRCNKYTGLTHARLRSNLTSGFSANTPILCPYMSTMDDGRSWHFSPLTGLEILLVFLSLWGCV